MRINVKTLLILLSLVLVADFTFSQEIPLSVKLLKDTILIGEQTELQIEAKVPAGSEIIFPVYKDTISANIDLILDSKPVITEAYGFKTYQKSYLFTSFDTGFNSIAAIPLRIVTNADTNYYLTNETQIFVKPFVLLDTIPVDTTYADRAGYIVFGKDGFKKEIEKYIPDSVKQSMSSDSLEMLKASVKDQLLNLFSSELTKNTALYNQDDITKIAEASSQKMFIVDKSGILADYIVAGSVDTVFVQEYQQVTQGQPLFTLYRIKDINEELYNTPFNFAEFWFYLKKYFRQYWWILVLCLVVAAALVYFFMFYKKDKKPVFFKVKPKLPAHIIALDKLEQIRKEKIWSKGHVKEYHSQVTDVLREYIENRFGVYAMEMTTSEIIESFEKLNLVSDSEMIKLRQTLEIADAVKFAKYQALQNENDLSLKNSFDFVENTKEVIEENSDFKQSEAEIEVQEESENIKPKENE